LLTWEKFEKAAPELARFGADRMSERVMYLGTVRKDGYPRVHPFTPFIGSGHLFAFMEPTSPKGHDIQRDGRFVIHSLVKDMHGTGGEFSITGKARMVNDPQMRTVAVKGCPYTPSERYVLFEFLIEEAATTHYPDGKPQHGRWKESSGSKS
jgi:Pyridoxamine 5'-phosphate oxidase